MIKLKADNKFNLEYDEDKNLVLLDGKITKDWIPSFTPNGEDTPDFFGFIHKPTGVCYTIYGTKSKVSDEDKIKL